MRVQQYTTVTFACCFLIVFFATDLYSSAEEVLPNTSSLSIVRKGYVEYGPFLGREGKIAALGDPYRYHVYPATDINQVIEEVIQFVGFSLNPMDAQTVIPECAKSATDFDEKQYTNIWTDYLLLDDDVLARLSATRKSLGLDPRPTIHYDFQVVGCYWIVQDGADTPFSDPMAAYHARPGSTSEMLYWTRVDLVLSATMRKRGTKGSFVEVEETVYPKKLLDSIMLNIRSKAYDVPIKILPFMPGV